MKRLIALFALVFSFFICGCYTSAWNPNEKYIPGETVEDNSYGGFISYDNEPWWNDVELPVIVITKPEIIAVPIIIIEYIPPKHPDPRPPIYCPVPVPNPLPRPNPVPPEDTPNEKYRQDDNKPKRNTDPVNIGSLRNEDGNRNTNKRR